MEVLTADRSFKDFFTASLLPVLPTARINEMSTKNAPITLFSWQQTINAAGSFSKNSHGLTIEPLIRLTARGAGGPTSPL